MRLSPVGQSGDEGRSAASTAGGAHGSEPSERFRWLEAVREREARRKRIAALRAELQECRDAGKRIRHERRLRQAQR